MRQKYPPPPPLISSEFVKNFCERRVNPDYPTSFDSIYKLAELLDCVVQEYMFKPDRKSKIIPNVFDIGIAEEVVVYSATIWNSTPLAMIRNWKNGEGFKSAYSIETDDGLSFMFEVPHGQLHYFAVYLRENSDKILEVFSLKAS